MVRHALVIALISFFTLGSDTLFAHDLPIKISTKLSPIQAEAMNRALAEVAELLPAKLKAGLPQNIELKIEKLTDHQGIPADVCTAKPAQVDKDKKVVRPFVYGEYSKLSKTLVLNIAVLNELIKGKETSTKINCQHKSLYDQAIATIVHELTHAYDFNNQNVSSSIDFVKRAGFKRGLLKTKNKNIEAMRSVDPYETVNVAEDYAVNMEYFAMDEEYACRKPAMFDYFKRAFEMDPFPKRNCTLNRTVMMSTAAGYYPMKLDPARIYRVDYLLAAPGKDLSSGFGHSMFRIVLCAPEHFDPFMNKVIPATPFGKKCLEDKMYHLVVSYRANVEDATLNYMKGLFGGYPSMLFILNFSDVLDEYNRDELRDVVSYPLNLSAKDKEDLVNKILEDHWNYRGSYKFVTNNCAVESYDLLKSALENSTLQTRTSVSPKGVLEDLDKLEFVSIKSGTEETYKAKTDALLLALRDAYGVKLKDSKKDKKTLQDFIDQSSTVSRMNTFSKFADEKINTPDLHTKMSLMKARLVKASSFSVMEQQILRSKMADMRKKAAELIMNSKDEKVIKIREQSTGVLKQDFGALSTVGYGVPLTNEMLTREELDQKRDSTKETIDTMEEALKELMPNELALLNNINQNINVFNEKSLAIRKSYRENLEKYIQQVITNLTLDDQGRALLAQSLTSDESLGKVRDLLDRNLVSEKEILDVKLRKIIQDSIGH